jgi:hypothetical protein
VGAGEKLLAVQVHLLILGAAGTAADGHITQVCPHQSGLEIVSGHPAYSRYPANGRPPRRRDHIPARAPDAEPECSPVYRTRDWSAGACHLRVPSTRTGACMSSNTMVTAFRCYASATRVRSNAPGRCSNCLEQRPTRLREYPSCPFSRYVRPYRASIDADLFSKCLWALRDSSRSVWRCVTRSVGASQESGESGPFLWLLCGEVTRLAGQRRHRVLWCGCA